MTQFSRFALRSVVVFVALLVATTHLSAQTTTPTGGTVPTANPGDVSSIDAIIAALYDVVSGPAGEERDWARMRSLFDTEARLIPTSASREGTGFGASMWNVDGYIEGAGPGLAESGFFEVESNRVEEVFENIAHVFSTYESRRTPDGPVFMRGINSIQLMFDGDRWWIMNIMWRGVGADFEFPGSYLPEH